MKRIALTIAILLSISVLRAQTKYQQPMDIQPLLSASYAELRANHFHSGIDITTSGATGIAVRAVADGYVSRINVSAYGYGHALYITHYDGNTTVYAHLNSYAPKIDSVITAEQYRRKSFTVDYENLPKDLITVKRGEVVAYSGNTGGSGGPHLHFEVRDTESEEPLNPLAYLPKITDNVAPTVYGIKIYAIDDNSQVSGECADKYFKLNEIADKTIQACGRIGFGIHANDFFTGGRRPCGVVEVSLYDGDDLLFQSRLDRFHFDETRYINSFIDYAEYQTNKRYIQKSFVEPNNRLRIYNAQNDFNISAGEERKMRYVLKDFAGNKTEVRFTVAGKKNANAKTRQHAGYKVSWDKTWAIDTLNASVLIPSSSLYRDEYISISTSNSKTYSQPVYSVGSERIPLQKKATITIPVPPTIKKLIGRTVKPQQVFAAQLNSKNKISYAGGTYEGGNVTLKTQSLGDYVIAVDTIAPKVFSKNTRTDLVGKNSVMVGLADDMSGIDKYNCYINDEWKLFQYDYKNTRLISRVDKLNLKAGKHKLKAVVEDTCGNETVFEWDFTTK